jgi:GntR family transcriptional regulator/MocR family aminotransferase
LFVTSLDNDLIINQSGLEKLESKTKKAQVNTRVDFNSGKVDLKNFPYAVWRKLTVQALYEDQGELFYNGSLQGEELLREQIAA